MVAAITLVVTSFILNIYIFIELDLDLVVIDNAIGIVMLFIAFHL